MLTPEQEAAVERIAAAAVSSQVATGCPAALSAAQCIFESGYLSRCPGNNCFGIKADAHGSGTQYVLTHEFLDGSWTEMPLAFEAYPSLVDCFSDHARLIQNGVYAVAWQAYAASSKDASALDEYIAGVAAHYATDPNYRTAITNEAHSATVQNALAKAMESTSI
jgi:flagellum-specific peptidoglycan hydrolase FlgJ